MDAIHKYELGIPCKPKSIILPLGAVPVHFGMQGDRPYMWVREPVDALTQRPRNFLIVGTGHRFSRDAKYIGTCQDGQYVWHVVETP